MHTLRTFFKDRERVMPQEGLEKRILQAVSAARNRETKHRLVVAYVGITASFGALLYSGVTFGKLLLESDFWSIVALIFSDLTVALQYWNNFLLSLLETFPAFSVASVLLPTFILLLFLNMFVSTQRGTYSFKH